MEVTRIAALEISFAIDLQNVQKLSQIQNVQDFDCWLFKGECISDILVSLYVCSMAFATFTPTKNMKP